MEPVRVKVYGLTSMTRRGYLTLLAVEGLFAAAVLCFWWLRWDAMRPDPAKVHNLPLQRGFLLLDYAPWLVAGASVLLLIEARIVLRRFARKEAERAAQQSAKPQANDPPKS